jgi:flagellar hook-associated protein 1 FlgK
MSTLASLFDLSRGALLADQAALNVTANNVANQNTAGYTNQVVSWTEGDTVALSGGQRQILSPTVTTSSLRDRVLEQRVQQQTQQQSSTAAEAAVLGQIENVFSISTSATSAASTQLGTSIDSFFNSLSALAANPSDAATQTAAVNAATVLANTFNAAASGLASVQTSVNSSLQTSVTQVNDLTATIAKLNNEISSNDPNQDAGQLEDQRQNALAQLSQYIGLNQIATESNGITLTTTGGTLLVAGSQSFNLAATQTGSSTVLEDSSGNNITATVGGGSIGGQLNAQSVDLPAAQNALDALAFRIGSQINQTNQTGLLPTGAAGGAIFSIPSTANGAAASISVISPTVSGFASAGIGEGSTGNTNANALIAVGNTLDLSGQTITGNLAALLGDIGSNSAALQEQSAAQQASLTQLTTQRDTLSGVNLDTEASNLTIYQRAYQAAAQVLTIVNTLLASSINLGTETTVT